MSSFGMSCGFRQYSNANEEDLSEPNDMFLPKTAFAKLILVGFRQLH